MIKKISPALKTYKGNLGAPQYYNKMNLPVRNLPGEPIVEPFGSCRPIGKDLRSPRPARRARPGAGSGLTRPRWSPGLHPLSSYGPSATKKDVSNPFSNWVGQQSWVGFSARKSRCERGSACPPAPYIGALSRRSNFLKNPPSKKHCNCSLFLTGSFQSQLSKEIVKFIISPETT